MTIVADAPTTIERYATDIDLFSHASLLDPYADYRALQDIGRLAYMRRHQLWVATRYDEVKHVLGTPQVFCSGKGIGLTDLLNDAWAGMSPTLDGADHAPLRLVMMQTIGPKAVAAWQGQIETIARKLVDEVLERGEFDAVADFAQLMPMRSVVDILGISPEMDTRRDLLHWATDSYNCCGPAGTYDHTLSSMEKLYGYALANLTRDKVRPGSVGDLTYRAVDAGTITEQQALGIIAGYFTAGLDTTAAGIGNLMLLLSRHPGQYRLLRDDPSLVPAAFQEAVRVEAPAQWFSRVTTQGVDFDDIHLPEGTRLMFSYAAANRDERHYPRAAEFDVRRNPTDHMGFGHGVHTCMGKWLSNMEVHALMNEVVRRVDAIEPTGQPVQHINNLIRSLDSLPVRVRAR